MKEAGTSAPVSFRNLYRHHADFEQFVDELAGNLRVLVHLLDERSDFSIREFHDAVAEQNLVLGEGCEGEVRRFYLWRRHDARC